MGWFKFKFKLSFLSCVTGAILVIQPTFIFKKVGENNYHGDYYYIGAIIALSTALLIGITNITINYCREVNSGTIHVFTEQF